MYKVFSIAIILLLPGCEVGGGTVEFPKATLFDQSIGETQKVNPKDEACRLARIGFGMPILLDPTLRKEAYTKMGAQKASAMLRPVARANNSFRCICGTAEEKLKAKC